MRAMSDVYLQNTFRNTLLWTKEVWLLQTVQFTKIAQHLPLRLNLRMTFRTYLVLSPSPATALCGGLGTPPCFHPHPGKRVPRPSASEADTGRRELLSPPCPALPLPPSPRGGGGSLQAELAPNASGGRRRLRRTSLKRPESFRLRGGPRRSPAPRRPPSRADKRVAARSVPSRGPSPPRRLP